MSEIANLIKELKEHGVGLKVVGDNLEVSLFKDDVDEAIFDQLRAKKPEIIQYINSLEVRFQHQTIPLATPKDAYPLSNAQLRIWIANKFEGASKAYNIPQKVYVHDSIDKDILKMSILRTVERHEILRTIFIEKEDGEVLQKVLKMDDVEVSINFKDLRVSQSRSVSGNNSPEEIVQRFIDEDYLESFDLESYPLFKVCLFQLEEKKYVFYCKMHHIISDGWSSKVFSDDVLAFYDILADSSDRKAVDELNTLTVQYKDYAEWQRSQISNDFDSKQRTYWINYLSGELPRLDFPLKNSRPLVKTYDGRRFVTFFGADLTGRIQRYAERNGGTLFMGLLAAWNILCERYTRKRDIIIGTLTTGRDHPDLQNQIGYYVNTMVLRNSVQQGDSFDSFFEEVRDNILNCYQYQSYPFDHLVDELHIERDSSRSAIFDVMVTMDNIEENVSDNSPFEEDNIIDDGYIATKFDLDVNFQEAGQGLSFQLVFNTDLYADETIEFLMRNYRRFLEVLLNNHQERIDKLDFLSIEERSRQLNAFNDEIKQPVEEYGIVELFQKQADKTPENVAIVSSVKNKDGQFEDHELSYSQLSETVNRFAIYLKEIHQIGSTDFVGVMVKRSEWSVISMLALLRLGCTYVPIDPSIPQKRIDFIQNDANLELIIDDQEVLNYMSYDDIDDQENGLSIVDNDGLAYLIYTSGTTGTPKGVMIQQRSMLDYVLTFKDYFKLSEKDKVIHHSSISFDTHVEEIFPALLSGASVLIGENGKGDIAELEYQIQQNGATVLSTTPWILKELNQQNTELGNIRLLISGGDTFSVSYVSNYLGKIDIYDTYGPSETTVCATVMQIKSESDEKLIGKPYRNTSVYVLGNELELLPIGAIGEICIGGNGLAKGYLNQPQLTEEKFVCNPFEPEQKLYRTGDLARWTHDGNLQFLGRKDDQVNIRGYRIEVEEIKATILHHPKIKDAVIQVIENSHQEKELVLFFTLKELAELDAKLKGDTYDVFLKTELRQFLQETLPSYMIPKIFLQLREIPMNTSGKVDMKMLSEQIVSQSEVKSSEFIGPRDTTEEWLSGVFQEILEVEEVDIHSSFFSIGGNSLSAIRLISRIQKHFDIKLDIGTLFRSSTIEQIGSLIKLTKNESEDIESEHFTI